MGAFVAHECAFVACEEQYKEDLIEELLPLKRQHLAISVLVAMLVIVI